MLVFYFPSCPPLAVAKVPGRCSSSGTFPLHQHIWYINIRKRSHTVSKVYPLCWCIIQWGLLRHRNNRSSFLNPPSQFEECLSHLVSLCRKQKQYKTYVLCVCVYVIKKLSTCHGADAVSLEGTSSKKGVKSFF